jgi:hypothetical protein
MPIKNGINNWFILILVVGALFLISQKQVTIPSTQSLSDFIYQSTCTDLRNMDIADDIFVGTCKQITSSNLQCGNVVVDDYWDSSYIGHYAYGKLYISGSNYVTTTGNKCDAKCWSIEEYECFYGVTLNCVKCVDTCTDSDGIDYDVKGTITGNYNGNSYTYTDMCYSGGIRVGERKCVDGLASIEGYDCPNGCSDGKCIEGCAVLGDTSNPCDNKVSNQELLTYIGRWTNNEVSNTNLLTVINTWVGS